MSTVPQVDRNGQGTPNAEATDTPLIVSIPGPGLIVNLKPEVAFVIRSRDWQRIRQRMTSAKGPLRWLEAAAWSGVGTTVSLGLAYVSWLQAAVVLTPAQMEELLYLGPALLVATGTSASVAAIMFVMNAVSRKKYKEEMTFLLNEIDGMTEI